MLHVWEKERRSFYWIVMGIPQGMRLLGIPTHRWEVSVKMDLSRNGMWCVDWIDLAQDRQK
jgi:hypothetical protein